MKLAIDDLAGGVNSDRPVNAQKELELANNAYLLYLAQSSVEKAKLLRMLCWNFSVGAVSAIDFIQISIRRDL